MALFEQMILLLPLVCVASYMAIIYLLTPSQTTLDTLEYLFHKMLSCPLDETLVSDDQTIPFFDNFYDLSVYNQLMDNLIRYYTYIDNIVVTLLIVFIVSLLSSGLFLIDYVIFLFDSIVFI